MKLMVKVTVFVMILMPIAWAEKPEWAGKGKPSAEQKAAHKAAMKAKESQDDREASDEEALEREKAKKEKMKKHKTKTDAEKHVRRRSEDSSEEEPDKSEKERKELGKGSDKGQQSREEHSRKWWQFWEED